jgi:carboxymethylenebutenolidase
MDGDRVFLNEALSRRTALAAGTTLGAGFALAAQPICAQTVITTPADGLTASEVKVKTKDGKEMMAYRAMPASGTGFGTVLVVQEIFGVHEYIKDVTRRFAKAGFYAIAPDLYFRQGDATKISDVQQLLKEIVSKVPDEQVMSDLDATLAWANKNGGNAAKATVTGFCWGGRIVWLYAAHNPKLKGGVAWYGRVVGNTDPLHPKNPIDIAANLRVPVLGLYGGQDTGIPVDGVEQMRRAVPARSGSDIVIYPNAPHGFNADYRPSYRADAALDGWQRMLTWFKTHGAPVA